MAPKRKTVEEEEEFNSNNNNNNNNNNNKEIKISTEEEEKVSILAEKPAEKPAEKGITVTFADVSRAQLHNRERIPKTPLSRAHDQLLEEFGVNLFFKKEFHLATGSFKERGACNALLQYIKDCQRKGVPPKGVITASAGNHALAVAYHGKALGLAITVVCPINAPLMKVTRCRELGARVISHGKHIGESKEKAMSLVEAEGLKYVNGYDDPDVIAGAGTIGLEIVEQIGDCDAVIIPVGGGGLIAGIAVAIKTLLPDVKVIGVEPENVPSMKHALEVGHPETVSVRDTLSDGLAVPCVGLNAFTTAQPFIDKIVLVSEKYIALAVLKLIEVEKSIVEGAGAISVGAILQGVLPELKGKKVVAILCGGNIDTSVLGRAIERGLASAGRLHRFVVTVPDRPGGIAKLTEIIARVGASVKDLMHERAWMNDIHSTDVRVMVETYDQAHAERLRTELINAGMDNLRWNT